MFAEWVVAPVAVAFLLGIPLLQVLLLVIIYQRLLRLERTLLEAVKRSSPNQEGRE